MVIEYEKAIVNAEQGAPRAGVKARDDHRTASRRTQMRG